jgi:hypothetical protein
LLTVLRGALIFRALFLIGPASRHGCNVIKLIVVSAIRAEYARTRQRRLLAGGRTGAPAWRHVPGTRASTRPARARAHRWRRDLAGQAHDFREPQRWPVSSVLGFYKIAPAEMPVAHDDRSACSGRLRLKAGEATVGDNGLRDLISAQGDAFWRLRIGVGHPGTKNDVVDFVLTHAGKDEQRVIDETISAGADAIEEMLRSGAQIAMNKLHSRGNPPATAKTE